MTLLEVNVSQKNKKQTKKKTNQPFNHPSVLCPSLASQRYLRLASVLQLYEATQQASSLFQYTLEITVQRPKEIHFKSVTSFSLLLGTSATEDDSMQASRLQHSRLIRYKSG